MTIGEKIRLYAARAACVGGALFCALAAFGMTDAVCRTQGCALFKGAAIYGVNMYWLGVAGFAVLCAALFAKDRVWSRPLLFVSLWLALVLDAALLAAQAVTVPCMNCLVVATLLGLAAVVVFPLRSKSSLILLAWAFFYVAGLLGLAGEFAGPVPLRGAEDSPVRIFFSPTCPACSDLLVAANKAGVLDAGTALFPVAKSDEDVRRIVRLQAALAGGEELGPALWTCFNEEAPQEGGEKDFWRVWLSSWRNKAFLARAGVLSVPYVFSDTLLAAPGSPVPATPAPGSVSDGASGAQGAPQSGGALVPGLSSGPKGCGFATDEDCER